MMGRVHLAGLLVVALALVSHVCAFGQQSSLRLTRQQCERLAIANSHQLKQARTNVQFSEARASQAAHAAILPKFELKNVWGPISRARIDNERLALDDVHVSPDTNFTLNGLRYYTEFELSLLQPLFTFGKLSNLKRAARYGVSADQASLDKEKSHVLLSVREAYWSLLLARELIAVAEDARREVTKADAKIEEKLDEGSEEVSQTDLFKLQIFKYEVNKRLRKTLDDSTLAAHKLRLTVGSQDEVEVVIVDEFLEPVEATLEDVNAYLGLAARNRADVVQLQAGLGARRALVNVARSDYFPQFFIGGQVKYNFAKDRFDSKNPFVHNPTNFFRPGILVGFNLNLNYTQTRDKVRMAQAEYGALSQKSILLDEKIRLDVRQAFLATRRAETNMLESRKALKASENWLRSATMTFDIGVGEVKELIDAFKANGQMQTEYLKNIYSYNVALAKLSFAVGRDLYPETPQVESK